MIECHNLKKQYRDTLAVDGASFQVSSGRVVGLLGPNGAGKSTIMRILTTVIRPDGGSACVGGFDIATQALRVRQRIAVVPQSGWLNHYLSLRDNILVYLLLRGTRWREAQEKTEWAMDLFELNEHAHKRCEQLSGGLIRRTQIARVLATEAPCLFLDEPSVGLDPRARREFWSRLAEQIRREGTTTLLATHSMEEVESLCDDVILVNKGQIVAQGSVGNLMSEFARTRVEIELSHHCQPRIPERISREVTLRGNILTVDLHQGQKALPQLLEGLADGGCRVRSLKVLQPRFEDVYLSLIPTETSPDMPREEAK